MALRLLDIADGFASAGLPSDVTFTSAPFVATPVQSLTLDSVTAQTFIAPAGARFVKIHADAENVVNIKVSIGGTASATIGNPLEPGRSEDWIAVANVSIICKANVDFPTPTDQGVYLTWGV